MLATAQPETIASAPLSVACWARERRWVQEELIRFHDHPDPWVRHACAVHFGHVARVNGQLDMEKVEALLSKMLSQISKSIFIDQHGNAEPN